MIQNINLHACAFATMVGGALWSFQHLHVVTYSYRSSPSLAYWVGNRKEYIKNLHFISSEIRDKYVEELRKDQTLFRFTRMIVNIKKRLCFSIVTIVPFRRTLHL